VQGLGFMASDSGSRVLCLWFRVSDSGFGALGFGILGFKV